MSTMTSVLETMFNDKTKEEALKGKIIYMKLSDIIPNEKNMFSVIDIEPLSESIKDEGLLQPIIVYEENEKKILHTGHRRYAALLHLMKNKHAYSYFGKDITGEVPVILISNEGKDDIEMKISMIRSNSYRQLSDADKNKIIDITLDYVGYLESKGTKQKGRTREIVAEITGFSLNYVKQYLSLKNKSDLTQNAIETCSDPQLSDAEKEQKAFVLLTKKINKLTKDAAKTQLFYLNREENQQLRESIDDLKIVLDQLID